MTDINKLIEQTERLLAAATPGDYLAVDREDIAQEYSWEVGTTDHAVVAEGMRESDAHLFAHAPTALRALVDEVYRLRRQVDKLEFDATTQPNSKTVAAATPPESRIRTCSQCRHFPVASESDGQGEHHPACEHAPPNPRNAGPRYRAPTFYEGNAS